MGTWKGCTSGFVFKLGLRSHLTRSYMDIDVALVYELEVQSDRKSNGTSAEVLPAIRSSTSRSLVSASGIPMLEGGTDTDVKTFSASPYRAIPGPASTIPSYTYQIYMSIVIKKMTRAGVKKRQDQSSAIRRPGFPPIGSQWANRGHGVSVRHTNLPQSHFPHLLPQA